MSKRKKANPWDSVFDRVEAFPGDPEVRYSPRPTDAELDQLEVQIGSQLPASYRAFMLRLGPGDFEGVNFFPVAEVAKRTLQYRKISQRDRRRSPHLAWLSTLVPFGDNSASDRFVWDPTTGAASNSHECQLYHIQDDDTANVVGGSFVDLANWARDAIKVRLMINAASPPRDIFLFMREAQGMKEAPKDKHVKLWLAFNNHAVRDLALSIRDEKRPDVFPILADALEEAGCTNADMLNSCRTGDPDIDGVWVLRVLLGKES